MDKTMTKKEQEFIQELQAETNEGLIEWLEGLSGGDDYDGCFTKWGRFRLDQLKIELLKRLNK